MSKEITIQHALSKGGFPQLRIMADGNRVNDDSERYISVGVLDSLGNTEWTEVTLTGLADALIQTGVLDLLMLEIVDLRQQIGSG